MHTNRLTAVAATLMVACIIAGAGKDSEWTKLFDGKTLAGWKQLNGIAKYSVEDSAILGVTSEGSPNSFLCTDKRYGNFELEFEVLVDPELNSGVQIRSLQMTAEQSEASKEETGRVFGPQVEIESGGGTAGYIYGEATPYGWLSPEPRNAKRGAKLHEHFRAGEWNHYRVLAKGPRIQTFINGRQVADLTHEAIYKTHPKGVIGLQVHGIERGTGPYRVRWRNIRIRVLNK